MILSPLFRYRAFNSLGAPLAGGKLYTYAATTLTPLGTYSDSGGSANTNPIILNANGECDLWIDPALSYKFVLKDANDVVQSTTDNITSLIPTAQIADSAVTTAKILDAAITGAKLNASAADGSTLEVAGGSMRIKDLGVATAKIADLGVTSAKLADLGVLTAKINDLAVTTAKINDLAVTLAKIATRTVKTDGTNPGAGGVSISTQSPSTFTTTNTSATDVTGLSSTLTVTGKVVKIKLVSDGSGNDAYIGVTANATSEGLCHIQIKQGATIIYSTKIDVAVLDNGVGAFLPVSIVNHEYVPVAGTYTYTLQIWHTGSSSATCNYAKLQVYEEA